MIRVAIIGYGYWGKNLLRNFVANDKCEVACVVDTDEDKRIQLKQAYPYLQVSSTIDTIFQQEDIDAVVIATPSSTHFELAKLSLENDKHVLIEKPMATSFSEASELMKIAETKNKIILVDHTFLYTPAVQKIKQVIADNEIGEVMFFDSTRINLGIFQSDVNVLWDLAAHDISILNYLVNEKPLSVQAIGISHTQNDIENIAYINLRYASNFIAHFNCSWTSPVKIRMLLIGGDKKMIAYNDLEPTEKVKIYNSGIKLQKGDAVNKFLVDYRTGDLFIPKLENTEALLNLVNEFVECIVNNTQPLSNAAFGLEVVRILEAAELSVKNRGKEVFLRDIVE